jgi:hypothetical protein
MKAFDLVIERSTKEGKKTTSERVLSPGPIQAINSFLSDFSEAEKDATINLEVRCFEFHGTIPFPKP